MSTDHYCSCQQCRKAAHQHLAHKIRELEWTKATVFVQIANTTILELCMSHSPCTVPPSAPPSRTMDKDRQQGISAGGSKDERKTAGGRWWSPFCMPASSIKLICFLKLLYFSQQPNLQLTQHFSISITGLCSHCRPEVNSRLFKNGRIATGNGHTVLLTF